MSNQTAPSPIAVVRKELSQMNEQFARALPRHIPPERFERVIMTAIQNDPELVKCNRQSLWNAAMQAAQDGLLPDKREGAFVRYKAEVQWIPMVGGVLKKIRNSGELKSMSTGVVLPGDQFEYWVDEEGEHLLHRPNLNQENDPSHLTHAYCIARTKSDGVYVRVMNRQEIEKVRAMSRAKKSGPWFDWYDQMAIKTVIRRISKVLPLSSDLDDLIRRDDHLYDLDLTAREVDESLIGAPAPTRPAATTVGVTVSPDDQPREPEDEKLDEWYETGKKAFQNGDDFKSAPRELSALQYDNWAKGYEDAYHADLEAKEKAEHEATQKTADPKPEPATEAPSEDKPAPDVKPDPERETTEEPEHEHEPKPEPSIDDIPDNETRATRIYREGREAFENNVGIFKVPLEYAGEDRETWRSGWLAAEEKAKKGEAK